MVGGGYFGGFSGGATPVPSRLLRRRSFLRAERSSLAVAAKSLLEELELVRIFCFRGLDSMAVDFSRARSARSRPSSSRAVLRWGADRDLIVEEAFGGGCSRLGGCRSVGVADAAAPIGYVAVVVGSEGSRAGRDGEGGGRVVEVV